MSKKVIIIGAGIGGIATASLLAKAGYDVHVYEKNHNAGGRINRLDKDGFTFDTGPSWYLMPEAFEQYFRLLGTTAGSELPLKRLAPSYKVFYENAAPITIFGDIDRDSAVFESVEAGAGLALKRYVAEARRTYALSLRHFLYTNFQRPIELLAPEILRHAGTMLSLAFRNLHSKTSAAVNDLRLQQILEYHAVFIGTSPFEAPALYSLMSTIDFDQGVYHLDGGMYTLIERMEALAVENGVKFYYNAPAKAITTSRKHATGIELSSGEIVTAEIVVSNADLHYTETSLVPDGLQTYPESYWKKRQPGPSALLLFLGVKGNLPSLEHHNLFFIDDWKANFEAIYGRGEIPDRASIYVCKPSATDPSCAPSGHENIFVLVPLPAGISPSQAEKETYADQFVSQFTDMAGIKDFSQRIVSRTVYGMSDFTDSYNSWRGGALGGPSHLLSQSAFFRSKNKSKYIDNLYYVGSGTVPGIGMPMCLISAEQVYKRIMGNKRGGPLDSI